MYIYINIIIEIIKNYKRVLLSILLTFFSFSTNIQKKIYSFIFHNLPS